MVFSSSFLLESVGIEGSQVHLCAMLFLQSPVQLFRPTLEAAFPTGVPSFSRGWKPTR